MLLLFVRHKSWYSVLSFGPCSLFPSKAGLRTYQPPCMYRHLPPICFGVCYTISRENNTLFAQNLHAFCNVATLQKAYNMWACMLSFLNFLLAHSKTELRAVMNSILFHMILKSKHARLLFTDPLFSSVSLELILSNLISHEHTKHNGNFYLSNVTT